jgi:hypothetical protein
MPSTKSSKKQVKKVYEIVVDTDIYTMEECFRGMNVYKQRNYLIPGVEYTQCWTFRSCDRKSEMPGLMEKYPHQW